MRNIIEKLSLKGKKVAVSTALATTTLTSAVSVFAADTTGSTDLDVLMGQMTGGIDTVKTGGLIIVGAVITIAIVFLGARWLWNMFRRWLSTAQ